jgi:hypothetical protein
MRKYVALAAVAASALLASSANAADLQGRNPTAPVVHIPVTGKTDSQIRAEIRTAAWSLCGAADATCVDTSVADAERQLDAIVHVKSPARAVEASADGALMVRVAVAGKSEAQLRREIDSAAHAVCEPMSRDVAEYHACLGQAVADAEQQLHRFTVASADVERFARD